MGEITTVGEDILARFDAVIDDLLDLSMPGLSGDEVLALLRAVEQRTRRLATVDHALIAEATGRGLAHDHGCACTAVLLTKLLRIGAGEARARCVAADRLAARRSLTGAAAPPEFARTAAAQAAGAISPVHARQITRTITDLPPATRDEKFDDLETFLVEQAREFGPDDLSKITRHLSDVLDPDGTLRDSVYRHRRRDLTVLRRSDGSASGSFELTAQTTEALLTLLDVTAAPRPSADGVKDDRTPGQRRHDGLLEALLMALRGSEASCNGVSATIIVTMTAEQLAGRRGLARTGHGSSVPVQDVVDLTGDARLFPVVFDDSAGWSEAVRSSERAFEPPLGSGLGALFDAARPVAAYGTNHRIFTEGERLAMIARDGGCSFPGCTIGPMWCEAHHVTDWTITRRTTVDDGTLACGYHHREFERLGWRCDMLERIPHWTAPAWIDPTRTPRRNTAHDRQLVC